LTNPIVIYSPGSSGVLLWRVSPQQIEQITGQIVWRKKIFVLLENKT